jgi:hypothetical protein
MCVSVGEPSRNRQFLGRSQSSGQGNNELVIHLRVVSPPDVTQTLMPALQADPTVMNLTVLTGAVSNPDGDALLFDVPQGAANQVIGRLRDGGVDQRGSIMLENVDTSISALADRYDALTMVDDSHAVGFVGAGGRGTPEHCGVEGRIDVITGTLGKAMGGASGGYVAAQPVSDPQAPQPASDPVVALKQLKDMLGAELISAAEFEAKKAQLLERM